ncbi:MAG: bifunctional glutamate N-acetyltransferase/amino-acid acetyltransferase ArgJ [Deltaproteobacteria bacterium]
MHKVAGFLSCGISGGIKKNGKKDLALIFSETPAVASGVFTTNIVKAAPVLLGMERIKGGLCQAVVINSGNANACTGERGMQDAIATALAVAEGLHIDESLVIPSSTGVIGVPLPLEKIKSAVPSAVLALSDDGLDAAAEAIMTTDKFPKSASAQIEVDGRLGAIALIGKGAGMIAPNMATMLAFILTDIKIEPRAQAKLLKKAADASFNRIIVDGDTSTNDTLLMLSNGKAGNRAVTAASPAYREIERVLVGLCTEVAEMIVQDGEGATKVVKMTVRGAKTDREADKIARTLGSSLLVKTALYGEDANWGRVLAAAGRAGVKFDPDKADLYFGDYKIVENGVEIMDEREVNYILKNPKFTITLDLNGGNGSAFVIASDITMEYIKINAHYRT